MSGRGLGASVFRLWLQPWLEVLLKIHYSDATVDIKKCYEIT